MGKKELLRRFPAHRLEGALRFSTHNIRVGTKAPDFALPDLGGEIRRTAYTSLILGFTGTYLGSTWTWLEGLANTLLRSIVRKILSSGRFVLNSYADDQCFLWYRDSDVSAGL